RRRLLPRHPSTSRRRRDGFAIALPPSASTPMPSWPSSAIARTRFATSTPTRSCNASTPGSVPEPSREVALAEIVEQSDEAGGPLATGDLLDRGQVRAGGLPDEESGRSQTLTHPV